MDASKLLVILDRQHQGKPDVEDYGAQHDLDGDGTVETQERESYLTREYLRSTEDELVSAGARVFVLSDGRYEARHIRANYYAEVNKSKRPLAVYVAAHVNAGGGDYGAVFYDHRSPSANGPRLAEEVKLVLELEAKELDVLLSTKSLPAQPSDWTKHAFNTIKGLSSPIGICYEPGFLDNPSHGLLWTEGGLRKVGQALAQGILYFAKMYTV